MVVSALWNDLVALISGQARYRTLIQLVCLDLVLVTQGAQWTATAFATKSLRHNAASLFVPPLFLVSFGGPSLGKTEGATLPSFAWARHGSI